MNLMAWARLVRIPTVFTILANVAAAYLLVAHSPAPLPRFLCIVLAGVALYWGGMIFNDVFDVEVDRRERPTRPLPAGAISLKAAKRAATVCLLSGVALAAISGWLPAENAAGTWRPVLVALVLVGLILLYDGPLKETVFAPVVMGGCRTASFLLGAAPVLATGEVLPAWGFEPHVWGAAIGYGVYVMGVTLLARNEAGETETAQVVGSLIVISLGGVLMALAPRMAPADAGFRLLGESGVAMMIGVLCVSVLVRGFRCLGNAQPQQVQIAVRFGLLTLIPLAATFALLGSGAVYGIAVFALVFPALWMSVFFRMT